MLQQVSYVCKNAFSAGIMAATLSRNDTINVEEEIDSKKRAIYDALDHLIPGLKKINMQIK